MVWVRVKSTFFQVKRKEERICREEERREEERREEELCVRFSSAMA